MTDATPNPGNPDQRPPVQPSIGEPLRGPEQFRVPRSEPSRQLPLTPTPRSAPGAPATPPLAAPAPNAPTGDLPLPQRVHATQTEVAASEPGRRRRIGLIAGGAVGALALIAGGVGVGLALDGSEPMVVPPVADVVTDTDVSQPAPSTPEPLVDEPGPVDDDVVEPVAAVASAVGPSVVRIDTGSGTGSGIIMTSDGLIVTNAHVVGGFDDVSVQLADGTRVEGEVIGSAPSVDVAVVQVADDLDLTPAQFAPASTVEVGQLAVAIGSPFGLEQSVTSGIVSAQNRVVTNLNSADGGTTIVEMVQTDAPINPGNSGGALADREGRVIGMNTSIRTDGQTQGNLGVGFAIPSDTFQLIADRIIAGEPLESGFLGVSGQDPAIGRPGALITEVVAGGPADAGGIEVGDLIVAVDGSPVADMSGLAAKVRLASPDTTVEVEVIRDDATVVLDVRLGELGRS